jgi:hypothetical protein
MDIPRSSTLREPTCWPPRTPATRTDSCASPPSQRRCLPQPGSTSPSTPTTQRTTEELASSALPELLAEGLVADAAFVDGSHRFHEVFVDLYFLRKIVRQGGVIVIDDDCTPSVHTAVRYYEKNLGWTTIPDAFTDGTLPNIGDDPAAEPVPRCRALRLPDSLIEPPFEQFHPF